MSEVLQEHVERFNAGVRSGEWGPMLEQFDEDAEMEFRGIPVGPHVGREAIAVAYRQQPPDDELRVLELRERENGVDVRYAWFAEPEIAAGEMLLTAAGGRISRLIVTFDRGVVWG